jgi:amino acid transporter
MATVSSADGAGAGPNTGLTKGTNWWGAFVIGLAGTILVTGIAPYVVQGTGSLGIILIGVMTIAGCFLCLCLAELATIWPDRTGGIPSFATESFRPLVGDRVARHIGGTSGWAYWLGWFPVAPINVILTASYLAVLFKFSPGHTIDPVGTTWGTPIGVNILLVCFALLLIIFIPSYLGIRLGAAFATVLGVLSMLPITAMIFLPFFKPGSLHWHNVAGFHAPPGVHVNVTFIAAWFFPILWNVIAMEAAACYVGECRGGARDAKIALTAEGIFGMFIYIATPLLFVAVLGLALTSADPLTLYLSYTNHIFGPGSWEQWFIGIPLVLALALSVLNAIMGCGRSLYQAAADGQLPRWFQHKNKFGVPDYAMAFNVVCSALLVLLGSPVRIYIISNGGYLLSCLLAFGGYFVYRHLRLRDLDGHLLLRRLEFAERRRRPPPGTGALPAGPAHRGVVRAAVLVAGLAGPQAGRGRRWHRAGGCHGDGDGRNQRRQRHGPGDHGWPRRDRVGRRASGIRVAGEG